MDEHPEEESGLAAGPGEYNVTFHHPAGSAPGLLDLQAEKPPSGTAWDLPLPEDGAIRDPDGTYRGHGFPAVETLPELAATLRSNLPARLEQVTLSHWMGGHAHLDAAVAIIGWAAIGKNPVFDTLRLQATGFAQFFGTRPLHHLSAPGLFDGGQAKEVTIGFDPEPDLSWNVQGVETTARWSSSIGGIGDAFHFEVKSSPWIEVTTPVGAPWDSWLHEWLRPLIDLVSLSTGDGQHPTVVEVSRPGDDGSVREHRLTARVFGSGVRQSPFTVRFAHHRPTLFTLESLPYSLNELITRWLDLRREITGFVDTYLPIVRGVRQTPAAELLLLSAAAEAIHSARFGEGPTSQEEHGKRRKELLSVLAKEVSKDDLAFLKDHLGRHARYSLRNRVGDLVKDCPAELQGALGLDGLAERAVKLRDDVAHGRGVAADQVRPVARGLRVVLDVQLLRVLELPLDAVMARERWQD